MILLLLGPLPRSVALVFTEKVLIHSLIEVRSHLLHEAFPDLFDETSLCAILEPYRKPQLWVRIRRDRKYYVTAISVHINPQRNLRR